MRRRFLKAALGSKQATHGVYIEIVVLAVIIALEGKLVRFGHGHLGLRRARRRLCVGLGLVLLKPHFH